MFEKSNLFVISLRKLHGQRLWWIGRGTGKDFTFYHDIYGPTGYGYNCKVTAERVAREIEKRLQSETR